MVPAGDPESNSVQEILAFQTHTIRMMYGLIGDALKAKASPDHPRDYLNFFCLGNREAKYATALPAVHVPHPEHCCCQVQETALLLRCLAQQQTKYSPRCGACVSMCK